MSALSGCAVGASEVGAADDDLAQVREGDDLWQGDAPSSERYSLSYESGSTTDWHAGAGFLLGEEEIGQ